MTSSEQPGRRRAPPRRAPQARPAAPGQPQRRLVPEREAVVPALDRAVTHGIGLYETFKLAGGVPVFFDEHMDRLQSGLEVLEIAVPWDRATIARSIVELSGASGIATAAAACWSPAAPPGAGLRSSSATTCASSRRGRCASSRTAASA